MSMIAGFFSSQPGLEFSELRTTLMRIPQVSSRVRQAQEHLDRSELVHTDLYSLLLADDLEFARSSPTDRLLLSTLVQVGLFDRFSRKQGLPDFLVARHDQLAMHFSAGHLAYPDLIKRAVTLDNSDLLSSYVAYQKVTLRENDWEYKILPLAEDAVYDILKTLKDQFQAGLVVGFGPGFEMAFDIKSFRAKEEIEFLDVIADDEKLTWFWPEIRALTDTAPLYMQ